MTETETSIVLAHIQAYDRRTVGAADIRAWWRALEDVPLEDAIEAVIEHYQETRDWMMPSDVRTGAHRIDWRRRGKVRREQLDAELAAEGIARTELDPPTDRTEWEALGKELKKRAQAGFRSVDDESETA